MYLVEGPRGPFPAASTPLGFFQLPIGAGGQITAFSFTPDGTKVCRCDTNGAWYFNPNIPNPGNAGGTGSWQQLVTLQSMPSTSVALGGGMLPGAVNLDGVIEIVIAPSNTQRFYMWYKGSVYRSDNRGVSWTLTNYSNVANVGGNNGNTKGHNYYMAVDPANADVVYCTTLSAELRVSADAGNTWSTVTTPGNAGSGLGHVIAFDPTSSVSGSPLKTQGIYVFTYGTGVYRSTDAGSNWTKITGAGTSSPQSALTTFQQLQVAADGYVWIVDNSGSNTSVWKMTGGTWTNVTTMGSFGGADGWNSLSIDPSNSARVVATAAFGCLNVSQDHGVTWTGAINYTASPTDKAATDIPWLGTTFTGGGGGFSQILFDPVVSNSNLLYIAAGVGVYTCNPPNSNVAFVQTSKSAGIEQLVFNRVIAPPSGRPNVAAWDRAQLYSPSDKLYPITQGPDNNTAYGTGGNNIVGGWDIDYCPGAPSTVVLLSTSNISTLDTSGFSSDGGQTWTQFGTFPAPYGGGGGSIAAASTADFIRVGGDPNGDGYRVYFSTNSGSTWTLATMPAAVPTSGTIGWNSSIFDSMGFRSSFAVDKVSNVSGVYKLYAANTSSGGKGLYSSTNGGATWTQVFTGFLDGGLGADTGHLKTAPGNSGHVFWGGCQGNNGASGLNFSIDGGVTWNNVDSGFSGIGAYGFGATYPGQLYPAILVVAYRSGNPGIWLCKNYNPSTGIGTWIDQAPIGIANGQPYFSPSFVNDVDGDKNTPGLFYICCYDAGIIRMKV